MYKISVPIMCQNVTRAGRDELLAHLRSLNAERVFLALSTYTLDSDEKKKADLDTLSEHCAFFKSHGFEVGAWIWTFWVIGDHGFNTVMTLSPESKPLPEIACPTDPTFLDFSSNYIADIARCGVDMIMFDDDFRYAFLANGPVGCICDAHMRMIEERTGERLERSELARRILSGGKNKYRDAWLASNGESFETFARRIREGVDSVDPSIRIGLCACLSSWDIDGTNPKRLARILAGSTKPFVRLIGAPYWAAKHSWGSRLGDVIELERMESTWVRDEGIEIFAEGDAYPRPRINCPASYLEGFDTAIRASGATDGILKYALDYTSSANYERGYVRFHEKNRPLYESIDKMFGDRSAVGVRIYESPEKVSGMNVGDAPVSAHRFQNTFFCTSARSLAACSIPTTYEGEGVCGACFGESARYLSAEARKSGLIIDATAARILHELGIDVGIEELGRAVSTATEHFLSNGEYVATEGTRIFAHKFKRSIDIQSDAVTSDGAPALSHMTEKADKESTVPMSYYYENADGERYLVLNFETDFKDKNESTVTMRHYERSRQYAEAVKWLSRGRSLPAFCFGNPELYTMVKVKDGAMSVGLWNFFADEMLSPEIKLDKAYKSISFLGCSGTLDGDTVRLSDIPAFGFAAFEVME